MDQVTEAVRVERPREPAFPAPPLAEAVERLAPGRTAPHAFPAHRSERTAQRR